MGVLSTAGVMRALCGVAGASSKASLSAHFARWGDLGEVNAVSLLPVLLANFSIRYIYIVLSSCEDMDGYLVSTIDLHPEDK